MPSANDGAAKFIIIPGPPLAADRQIVYSNDSKETTFDYYYLWAKSHGRKIIIIPGSPGGRQTDRFLFR